ncbi:MAG: hypothetical protein NTV86_14360 [Planctomycetota bacterium]|nr:hypothetical protein [Planctomycetota bacterium]
MDAFEDVIAGLLEREGYWIRRSFKVELTKAEKRRVGKASAPRWEIDLIAYKPATSTILAVECKSFLDSMGVFHHALVDKKPEGANRYKLFNQDHLWRVVFKRLVRQLAEQGACRPKTKVQLCLAAGKIASEKDRTALVKHFKKRKWLLFDHEWIMSRLQKVAESGYSNDVAAVVAKLLLKKPKKTGRDVEMQAEYDFSKGVRGKYAKRYAKGVTLPKKRRS